MAEKFCNCFVSQSKYMMEIWYIIKTNVECDFCNILNICDLIINIHLTNFSLPTFQTSIRITCEYENDQKNYAKFSNFTANSLNSIGFYLVGIVISYLIEMHLNCLCRIYNVDCDKPTQMNKSDAWLTN